MMESSSRKDELRERMERLKRSVIESGRECRDYEEPQRPSRVELSDSSMSSTHRGGSGRGDSMQEDYESILSSVLDDRHPPQERSGKGGPPVVSRGGWLDEDGASSRQKRAGESGYRFRVDDSVNETVALSIASVDDEEEGMTSENDGEEDGGKRKEKSPYAGMDDFLFPPSHTERDLFNGQHSGEVSPIAPKQHSEAESRIERKRLDEEVAILRERRNRSLGKLSQTLVKERASDIHSIDVRPSILHSHSYNVSICARSTDLYAM
jgi:hypothetical protein